MIKFEETKNVKILAKGILKSIGNEGIILEDEKEGGEDLLSFDEINKLLGKSIAISIANKEIVEDEADGE